MGYFIIYIIAIIIAYNIGKYRSNELKDMVLISQEHEIRELRKSINELHMLEEEQ